MANDEDRTEHQRRNLTVFANASDAMITRRNEGQVQQAQAAMTEIIADSDANERVAKQKIDGLEAVLKERDRIIERLLDNEKENK